MLPVRIQQQLPALVGLITIQSPLCGPLSGCARNLLNAFNDGDSCIDVRVTSFDSSGGEASGESDLAYLRR
jgi:hypothetical protein